MRSTLFELRQFIQDLVLVERAGGIQRDREALDRSFEITFRQLRIRQALKNQAKQKLVFRIGRDVLLIRVEGAGHIVRPSQGISQMEEGQLRARSPGILVK